MDNGAAAGGLDRRLQVLPPGGPRSHRSGEGALEWLRLSDRDELSSLEEGVPAHGNSDCLYRPDRGTEQDEQAYRAGSDLDGLVAAAAGPDETPVRGTVFYKMSGSGNDFVILDGRAAQADSWSPERIRAV